MKSISARFLIIVLFAPLIALSWVLFVRASDISSTNFIIRDPVVGTGGECLFDTGDFP